VTPDPSSAAAASAAPTTFAGFRRGFVTAQPLGVGVLLYGMAFGLLAREAQFSLAEALAMSGFVYSGSAQLVAVNAMRGGAVPGGAAMIAVAGTILLLNARYMLYGAALRPWLGGASGWTVYPALAVLGDGNWILSMKAHAEGERDAAYVLGSGLAMFIPWLAGSWIGLSAGGLIRNPDALALDFLLVSFSAAMGVGMFKGRGDLKIVGVAAVAAALADRFLMSGSAILCAGLAGGLTAWLSFRDEEPTA
jgi:predicted branched-subunit amino acid permease